MSRHALLCHLGLPLLLGACSLTEGDVLQTLRPDLMVTQSTLPPLCTTELLSRPDCTMQSELEALADSQCAAHGLTRVELELMTAGCSASSARSATATCCPFSRPARCTLEQQRPADRMCRPGVDLIALADGACGVVGKRALIHDLLDYCQNGRWLGVLYWCCE